MANKTRIEMIHQVLNALGILVPGQAPSNEEISKVDTILDPALSSLNAQDIFFIPDPGTPEPPAGGEFDDSIFLATADWVANRIAGAFNLAGDPALQVKSKMAEQELMVIGRPPRTRKLLTTDSQLRTSQTRRAVFNFTSGQ